MKQGLQLRMLNIEGDGKKRAEVLIYDVIGADWYGGTSAKGFVEKLNDLGDLDEINVRINSPGGSIFDADAIYNGLVRNKARIIVDIDGLAASCASWIAMAGDEIRIAENAMMMVHLAMNIVFGNKNDMAKEIEVLEKLDTNIANTYAKRTGKKAAKFLELMENETWFTSEEALEQKLVDSIVKNKKAANNCFGPECARNFKAVPEAAKAFFAANAAATTPTFMTLVGGKLVDTLKFAPQDCGCKAAQNEEATESPESESTDISCNPANKKDDTKEEQNVVAARLSELEANQVAERLRELDNVA